MITNANARNAINLKMLPSDVWMWDKNLEAYVSILLFSTFREMELIICFIKGRVTCHLLSVAVIVNAGLNEGNEMKDITITATVMSINE